MTSLATIDDEVFQQTATHAVQSVFNTMLRQSPQPVPITEPRSTGVVKCNQVHVIGTAGLVGTINGMIYLSLDLDFANRCAARLLAMTSAEVDTAGEEIVNDVVGELTNMTLGAFKNQLCDRGFPCKLTIPTIIRGREFVVSPIKGATHRIYHYAVDGHIVVADILIGPAE